MKFRNYSGTAAQYAREYLDPDNTLENQPCKNRREAIAAWDQLEKVFASDGGTGMRCSDFVGAAQEIGGVSDDEWEAATEQEKRAFAWAVSNQGFTGDIEEWLALDNDERAEYELGAAGVPTE